MNPAFAQQQIEDAFAEARNLWTTCDWFTEFGDLHLNLNGLASGHTTRLANATCGLESQQWRAATKWLEQIENDAMEARTAANDACDAWNSADFLLAKQRIERACQIEAHWHQKLVWEPMRLLICQSMESD